MGQVNLDLLFSGVETAKASMDANYIGAGMYFLRINQCKADATRGGEPFVAIEMTVIHVLDDDQGRGHRMGEDVTHWIGKIGKMADMFLPNLKHFLGKVLEGDPDQVTPQDLKDMVAAEQPLAGLIIECRNRTITKRDGEPFTRVNYMGPVYASRLIESLTPREVERFFPGDVLTGMLQQEHGGEA